MFINKTSKDKKLKNNILALSSVATSLKAQDNEVINATSGMFKNDDGTLFEFTSVNKVAKELKAKDKYAYVDSGGTPNFDKAVQTWIFGKYLCEVKKTCYLDSVPTPGGSGALHLAFSNYLERDETVLLPNHMWENYLNMAKEVGINTDTYSLFNDKDKFNIDDLTRKVNELKNKQSRIMILINDPCENPTGFCMKEKDYDALINIAKDNPNTDFIYLMDVAYFDFYNVDSNIIKKRYAKFKDIPSNALEEIKLFKSANSYSCRASWSSTSTVGISIIERLVLNKEYRDSYEEEVKKAASIMEERSLTFLKAAKEVGLKVLPYERGFFICVPVNHPNEVLEALHEDKVHIIATKTCLRIALCSVNKNEADRLPRLIKHRLDILK